MPIQIHSPGWKRAGVSRSAAAAASTELPDLPGEFLPPGAAITDSAIIEPQRATRGGPPPADSLDLAADVAPGRTALLVVRHASGALTFHPPVQATTRGEGSPSRVRFQASVRARVTRGIASQAVKAMVVSVAKVATDKAASYVLGKLVAATEAAIWRRCGLEEGWVRVTREGLAAKKLERGGPSGTGRALLFIHGTFSDTASAYCELARSSFFDSLTGVYGDRLYGFDHFTLSRTPDENARMLLASLPERRTTFDVVTHSRGGLVLRSLVERSAQFEALGERFALGRAVLVAAPNEGTPLATPARWQNTIGWLANLLEMLPDNPFTTGPEFVANGLVWIANHVAGDLPGLRAMDGDGDLISEFRQAPGPPPEAYSALVANYQPDGKVLLRLLDAGLDQFFGSANDLVVPSEGGWRLGDPRKASIPGSRIGCFGPGGNLASRSVTHVGLFAQPETPKFLLAALTGKPQGLGGLDPHRALPDRRLLRDASAADAVVSRPGTARRSSLRGSAAGISEPLRVTVINGDLTFETEPLLIGHYRSTRLSGSELAMDALIGGAMSQSLAVGMYPQMPGLNQVFVNRQTDLERRGSLPRPKAVIVVGLGPEGKLRAADLVSSVRQAVIAWAQRIVEYPREPRRFELAATLMGSGGSGVSAGQAACLIAQGVHDANERLADYRTEDQAAPCVVRLQLIELFLDRATEAWRALRLQQDASPERYAVDEVLGTGTGALQRPPDSGYRGADYDFISVQSRPQANGEPELGYTLDTRRARSEVRAQRAQSRLLRDTVTAASNDRQVDPQLGRTLSNLLIPVELEAYLASSGKMQIELDDETARIPWELLDTNVDDQRSRLPWAIRTSLMRKLRTEVFRDHVVDADADSSVLVIGEPKCTDGYPRLEGARLEALQVAEVMTRALGEPRIKAVISTDAATPGADALAVINALFERPWRVVHITGHGALPEAGLPGGVVLSNGSFLGADEIANMRAVPELVFVNCCHLAADGTALFTGSRYDRASFASGVANALIRIGVRCVIAAGWAVDDAAASFFAETFYAALLGGQRFIDAVGAARAATYERGDGGNTWAAYQCYGDPDWVFRRQVAQADRPAEDFSAVASFTALKLALQRIIVQTKYQGMDPTHQLVDLTTLEERFGKRWGSRGDVAEQFGEAYVEVGSPEQGMVWYQRAVEAGDGRGSLRAIEQLSNVQARLAWEGVDAAVRHRDDLRRRLHDASGKSPASRAAARRALADADRKLRTALRNGDRLARQSRALLDKLRTFSTTLERESLVGSVFKRQALMASAAGREAEVARHLKAMAAAYANAQKVGGAHGQVQPFYPVMNRLAADVAQHAGTPRWRRLDANLVDAARRDLDRQRVDADFWIVASEIELRQYEAMAARTFAPEIAVFLRQYKALHLRVTATRMWASVYDTASLALRNYLRRGSHQEREAATQLLTLLRGYAHSEG